MKTAPGGDRVLRRIVAVLTAYKEIIILLLAIGAIAQTPHARRLWAGEPEPTPEVPLSVRVDSIARNVDALIRLQCLRDRDQWDALNLAGIPCERLVNTSSHAAR